ncbi:MAG: CHASE3 domain-containing protein, partial [Qipengyuania vulgaris]
MELQRPILGLRMSNAAVLLFIGAAMLGLIFLVYQTVEAERMQRERSELTSQILEELERVDTAAVNGETGQRGYIITLDRRYLEPFRQGREQIEPALRRLRELLGDGATTRQEELLDQIDALSRAKFSEMESSVVLVEDGRLLDARRAILTDEGQETMERLRRALDEMEDIERNLLADQAEETARIEGRVLPLLGTLICLLLISILLGSRLVSRAARYEAEAAQAAVIGEARDRADLL